jgi:hypothetical protein
MSAMVIPPWGIPRAGLIIRLAIRFWIWVKYPRAADFTWVIWIFYGRYYYYGLSWFKFKEIHISP